MFDEIVKAQALWHIAEQADLRADLQAAYALVVETLLELPPQSLVIFLGDLGAGKTSLVSLIVAALGSEARVSSPSYTLIHEYPTPEGILVHMDAYKYLPSSSHPHSIVPAVADTLQQLGLDDYLEHARLVIVEWGASLLPLFPEAYVLTFSLQEGARTLRLYQASALQNTLQDALQDANRLKELRA